MDKSLLNDVVDLSLYWIELERDSLLVVFWKFEDCSPQQFIFMRPSDHDVVQVGMKALVVDLASLEAVVHSEDLEGACARNLGM